MSGSILPTILFFLFASLACAGAVGVLLLQRIVYMAGALLVSLAGVAGLFFIAGADFVGLVQLMVYVGGTVVLLAFGVMLTARRSQPGWQVPAGQWAAGLAVGAVLLAVLLWSVLAVPPWRSVWPTVSAEGAPSGGVATVTTGSAYQQEAQPGTIGPLGWALLGVRTDRAIQQDSSQAPLDSSQAQANFSQAPPNRFQARPDSAQTVLDPSQEDARQTGRSGYLLPFEIISVHLVLVLIGAAFLARARIPFPSSPLPAVGEAGLTNGQAG